MPVADKPPIERLHEEDVESSLAVLVELVSSENRAVDAAVPASLNVTSSGSDVFRAAARAT